MAVTIVRTSWIDDDGTGTTGTVINNAVKTALYNDIDGGFAKLAQLAGGNAFTGAQSITGTLSVTGVGPHVVTGAVTGAMALQVRNTLAGNSNAGAIQVGNDVDGALCQLLAYSAGTTAAGYLQPNGTVIYTGGAGGTSVVAGHASGMLRFYTGGTTERLRIDTLGQVLINATANPFVGQLMVASDIQTHQAVVLQNLSVVNAGNFMYFINSAGAAAGNIAHAGATSVTFGTTSDARLKDDAGRATDVAALRALVIHDFAWKADGRRDRGVFAQDAHALFPRAVVPGTDETTADGSLARPWMTDYSKFVPDLIVGWQHHDADLAELRALLVTLKGSADAE